MDLQIILILKDKIAGFYDLDTKKYTVLQRRIISL